MGLVYILHKKQGDGPLRFVGFLRRFGCFLRLGIVGCAAGNNPPLRSREWAMLGSEPAPGVALRAGVLESSGRSGPGEFWKEPRAALLEGSAGSGRQRGVGSLRAPESEVSDLIPTGNSAELWQDGGKCGLGMGRKAKEVVLKAPVAVSLFPRSAPPG